MQPPSINNGQMTRQDHEHLRMLSIFYYIFGALGLIATLGMGVFLLAGSGMLAEVHSEMPDGPPPGVTLIFGSVILIAGVFSLAAVILNLVAGKALSSGGSRNLIYVAAALNCLNVPFGTALGIFTFIVLSRDSVRGHFR